MDCNSRGDTRDIAMRPNIAIPPIIEIPEREDSQYSDSSDDSDSSDSSDDSDFVTTFCRLIDGHPMPPGGWVGGRSEEGFIVPGHGGYLETEDVWGQKEIWIGWSNYPAPHWNEWHCITAVAGEDGKNLFQQWWYGQWI